MKNYIFIIVALFYGCILSAQELSQQAGTKLEQQTAYIERLKKQLTPVGLTDAQLKEITKIVEESWDPTGLTSKKHLNFVTQLTAVLTPEQLEHLDAKQGMTKMNYPPEIKLQKQMEAVERLKNLLYPAELTNAQVEQLTKLVEGSWDAERYQTIRNLKFINQVMDVLTPEQAEYREMYELNYKTVQANQNKWRIENMIAIQKNQEMADEIFGDEIIPMIRTQRFKLNKLMSYKDRKAVEKLQIEENENEESMRNLTFEPIRNIDAKTFNELPQEQKEERIRAVEESTEYRKVEAEEIQIKERIETLLAKYESEIAGLMEEIKDQRIYSFKKIWNNYHELYDQSPMVKLVGEKFYKDHQFWENRRFYKDKFGEKSYHKSFLMIDLETPYLNYGN